MEEARPGTLLRCVSGLEIHFLVATSVICPGSFKVAILRSGGVLVTGRFDIKSSSRFAWFMDDVSLDSCWYIALVEESNAS